MEVSEDEIRRDVRLQPHSGEKSGSCVLDALKAIELALGEIRQQSITNVQPGSHKRGDETVTDGLSNIGSDGGNAPQMVVAVSSDRVHMALHAEVSVNAGPEAPDSGDRLDPCIPYKQVSGEVISPQVVRTHQNKERGLQVV